MSFGLVIPGRPLTLLNEETPGSNQFVATVSAPSEVSEICVFFTQPLASNDIGGTLCLKICKLIFMSSVGVYFCFVLDQWEVKKLINFIFFHLI